MYSTKKIIAIIFFLIPAIIVRAQVPQMINYQGYLTNDQGDPVTGPVAMTFTIYDAATDGNSKWTETHPSVTVTDGSFSVYLGSISHIPDSVFSHMERHLGIKVDTDPEIYPRTRLVAVPFAYRAIRSDTAAYCTSGAYWVVTDSVLYTREYYGIARGGAGNILYRDSSNTMVNLGVACTTGVSTANRRYATVSGGFGNAATGDYSTVSGGWNNAANKGRATVGGGRGNTVDGSNGVISGGAQNIITDQFGSIGGGYADTITSQYGTIAGGSHNYVSGDFASVGGGNRNAAVGLYSIVGGGYVDSACGDYSSVLGGSNNKAVGLGATILGGRHNITWGDNSYAAGYRARAEHHGSFVWGDLTEADISTTGENQFLIRASGGIGIPGATSSSALSIQLNDNQDYGIVVEASNTQSFIGGSSAVQGHGGPMGYGHNGYLGSLLYGVAGIHDESGNSGVLGNIDYGAGGFHNSSGNYAYLGTSEYGVESGGDLKVVGHIEVMIDAGDGTSGPPVKGGYYRDNACLAWAIIGASGSIWEDFGVDTCERLSEGYYRIHLENYFENYARSVVILRNNLGKDDPSKAGACPSVIYPEDASKDYRWFDIELSEDSGFNLIVFGRPSDL